ncbi:ribose-5-phosphate isomerase RpiA [Paenibacillus flagellatus]|uniref:Ribose-5-phosphate isomerase A n=1 Tax=Paenibacillus flagellatus TaxID=2211139 RepID=A0A2V5KRY7_9BACL|nr:ribose-5-phosphate isomerase RpiA [Paenibacillus flagellatus]PYI54267.1 ribose 5-phosphate isomerase A [Paenibacillus flagellatus]
MEEIKRRVAEAAAEQVKDGMTVGLGTGSTAYWAIRKLGERVKEGLNVKAIATSSRSESLAVEFGIPLVTFAETDVLDVTIDGADEVDPALNLIKGGGGALLREKIVAAASRRFVVVVDDTKRVDRLGAFPLPVEVVTFGAEATKRALESLGCASRFRMADKCEYVTDNGNFILDCDFGLIREPEPLAQAINAIPGVVDNGLFANMAHVVMVGCGDGSIVVMERGE